MKRPHDRGIWLRLTEAFESVGITNQTDMGKACGIRQESVSKWKSGQNAPTVRNMIDISRRTGYAVQWLYTGLGPKMAEPDSALADEVSELLKHLGEEDRREVIRYIQFRTGRR